MLEAKVETFGYNCRKNLALPRPARIACSKADAGGWRDMKLYYTYVLISKSDGQMYIGWTDNLERRINTHNAGKVQATKHRMPLDLVYFEGCTSRNKAIAREKQLKTGFGRKYLKSRI